jgi:FKBP-type peptidyl-prolyl cis-trans isomerase FklB
VWYFDINAPLKALQENEIMIKKLFASAIIFSVTSAMAAESMPTTSAPSSAPSTSPTSIESTNQKVSYSFGLIFGKRLVKDVPTMDLDVFTRGLNDGFKGNAPAMSEQQVTQVLKDFQKKQQQEQLLKIQQMAIANKAAGEKFMAENKNKEGVVTLASGLQYKVLLDGNGSRPTLSDTVTLQYKGTLLNGNIIDASEPGKPVTTPVSNVISGWKEALQLMSVGAKWQLFIPPELAYGANGNRGIGPNETLIYELQLDSIVSPATETNSQSPSKAE